MKRLAVFLSFIGGFNTALGTDLTEAEIRRAIDWGRSSGVSNLVHELKQRQRVLINGAGLRDPIEKRVTLVTDFYRVALESAIATRELREWGVEDAKQKTKLGLIEVLLEANCYNSLYKIGRAHV